MAPIFVFLASDTLQKGVLLSSYWQGGKHASPANERTSHLSLMVKENKERDPSSSRRREPRVEIGIPLTVTWYDGDGQRHETAGYARGVNSYGCLLRVDAVLPDGISITLFNPTTLSSITARVVGHRAVDTKGRQSVLAELGKPFGVALVSPDPSFWGAEFLEARKTVLGEES